MDTKKIGLFIKEQRKQKNLTQKELAEILSCTDKAVSRWETGSGMPDVSFLIPLSKALDVSVNEILLGEIVEKEQLIQKSDDLIVQTIVSTDKKINKLHLAIYLLICAMSAIFMYATPATAGPGDEMGVIFLIFLSVPVLSLILGLTNVELKYKLTYPLVNVALFAPSVFIVPFYSNNLEILFLYSAIFAVSSLVSVSIGVGINQLTKYVKNHIK